MRRVMTLLFFAPKRITNESQKTGNIVSQIKDFDEILVYIRQMNPIQFHEILKYCAVTKAWWFGDVIREEEPEDRSMTDLVGRKAPGTKEQW